MAKHFRFYSMRKTLCYGVDLLHAWIYIRAKQVISVDIAVYQREEFKLLLTQH